MDIPVKSLERKKVIKTKKLLYASSTDVKFEHTGFRGM